MMQQRHHQHIAAAAAVAEISEQDAAEGPRQISHPVGRECEQGAGQRIDGRKEQLVEHQRRERVVHREVVVLERGARDAGERQALHVRCVAHFAPYPPPPGVSMTMTSSRATGVENAASKFSVSSRGAFDPVASRGRGSCTAIQAKRRDSPVVSQHDRRHGLEESQAPLDAIAAAMRARAARAAANPKRFEPHREAPLEHFRVREPRVGHVGLHGVGAVEFGPAPDPPAMVS